MQEQPAAVSAQEVAQLTRSASAADVYTATKNQRQELRNQLESLEDKRNDLRNELNRDNRDNGPPVANEGVLARIRELDARIANVDQQLAAADAAVAKAASIPGAIVERPPVQRSGPPDEIVAIPIVFTIAVLMPIAIAYARRIWKRGATVIAPVPREVQDKLNQLGEAVESIGLEVERIGEGQRFITKVFSESNNGRALGAGVAQPIPVAARSEHVAVPRSDAAL